MDPPPLVRRFPARADQIGPVRRAIAHYAHEHGIADADGVALAVSEALTNAVVHAYADAPAPGGIEVIARPLRDDGLEVRVCDEGRGMKPHPGSPGPGLGLAIVGSIAQRFEVHSNDDGGTTLTMVFATTS